MEPKKSREDEVKESVLAVLRQSKHGFARLVGTSCPGASLPRWKQLVNWLADWLGGDQPPFIDPANLLRWDCQPLREVARPDLVDLAMLGLAPVPACRLCGQGKLLEDDPGGHYCHAQRYDGAPLLCRNCANLTQKEIACRTS